MSLFQSMAASCMAEKTISVKKMAGGRSSYDIVAPDLTRLFVHQKLRKKCLINSAKFQTDPPSDSASILEKKYWWVASTPPPPLAMVDAVPNSRSPEMGVDTTPSDFFF